MLRLFPLGEEAIRLGRKRARVLRTKDGLVSEGLIGPEDTDCFALNRHRFENRSLDHLAAPAVYIVTKGEGRLFGPASVSHPFIRSVRFVQVEPPGNRSVRVSK